VTPGPPSAIALGPDAVLLARHGETADNRHPARFQGQLDTPLSDAGRAQARELGRRLAGRGLCALHVSSLRRALETARIVGEELGLEPRADARLSEAAMGSWQGRLKEEVEREEPGTWAAWRRAGPGFRFPGGESLAEFQARVLDALADVRAGPLPTLVICHGGSMRAALAAFRPGGLDSFHDVEPDNAEVVLLPPSEPVAPRAALGR
jgi:probable phosphoglycerate mutase